MACATEAVQWLIGHLRSLGVHELWAAIHPDNGPSIRLIERVGFDVQPQLGRPVASYDEGDLVFRLDATRSAPTPG